VIDSQTRPGEELIEQIEGGYNCHENRSHQKQHIEERDAELQSLEKDGDKEEKQGQGGLTPPCGFDHDHLVFTLFLVGRHST
jgi:hypothetical protein